MRIIIAVRDREYQNSPRCSEADTIMVAIFAYGDENIEGVFRFQGLSAHIDGI